MSARRWDSLHPATQASINMQRDDNTAHTGKVCGCSVAHVSTHWWLCDYHDGHNDGALTAGDHALQRVKTLLDEGR
jgi:hypothetical protein